MERAIGSKAIIVGCGDDNCLPLATLVVEQHFGVPVRRGDRVSIPGGARAFSYYDLGDDYKKIDKAAKFRAAALTEIDIYLSHGADRLFLANHNDCGFSPKFENEDEEEKWHINCLMRGYSVLKEHLLNIGGKDYSHVEIIMLYIIVDTKTDLFQKAKRLGLDGKFEEREYTLPQEKC